MASLTHSSSAQSPASTGGHAPAPRHHAPVTPGKVAMWLFLATEGMFFTGLIGTYILICSSVTMVLALAAIQDGKKKKGSFYLLATVLIGSCFLGVQVYEYYQLMVGHHYPPGISATGHFRPSVSLFASCFFTMTG